MHKLLATLALVATLPPVENDLARREWVMPLRPMVRCVPLPPDYKTLLCEDGKVLRFK